eukprot:scaffold5258_cov80-Skeletonema_dohrnii-CCMP3373.AAC.2
MKQEVGAAPGLDKKNCKCPNDRIAPGSIRRFSSASERSGSLFYSANPSGSTYVKEQSIVVKECRVVVVEQLLLFQEDSC